MRKTKKVIQHARQLKNMAICRGVVLPDPDVMTEPQCHFVMEDQYHRFMLPLSTLLLCLQEAEKQGEVPELSEAWWQSLKWQYPVLN